MRKLLFEVAKSSDYNMSSSYGKSNNCDVPDSCTSGSKIFITYGHEIDVDAVTRDNSAVLVSMFREPMSWLFSRWKHAYKFADQKISLANAALNFGDKYFNFADTETKKLLTAIFEKSNKNNVPQIDLQNEIKDAMEKTRHLFREKCVVLLYDRFNTSVAHISKITGNEKIQKLFAEKYSHMSINSAPKDQYVDKMMNELSADTIKYVKNMLFLHLLVYEEAVLEFTRQTAQLYAA
jgi:hypothetical protein